MTTEAFIETEELECRICRSGAEPTRSLLAPCLCSGSIGLVHQDCLEQWLQHSKKDKCELCCIKYTFCAEYAKDMPNFIPLPIVVKTAAKKFFTILLPFLFRVGAAIVVWPVVVPFIVCQTYRLWMRQESITHLLTINHFKSDVISGIVLSAFIILTFVVMMSFADFFRVHAARAAAIPAQEVADRQPAAPAQRRRRQLAADVQEVALRQHDLAAPAELFLRIENHPLELRVAASVASSEVEALTDLEVMANGELSTLVKDTPSLERSERSSYAYNAGSDGGSRGDNHSWDDAGEDDNPAEYFAAARDSSASASSLSEVASSSSVAATVTPSAEFGKFNTSGVDSCDGPELEEPVLDVVADIDDQDGGEDAGAAAAAGNDPDEPEEHIPVEGIAFDELLGLRGVDHLARNSVWLMAFIAVFIGLFAATPYMTGLAFARVASQSLWLQQLSDVVRKQIAPSSSELVLRAIEQSAKSLIAVQVLDVLFVAAGYCIYIALIFIVAEIMRILSKLTHMTHVVTASRVIQDACCVLKVAILMSLRVFILPIVLGTVVLYSLNTFLRYDTTDWVNLLSSNTLGCGALAWACGISYMVVTTLSVLQLREILHPDALARFIRPQEPHAELLHSLMHESILTHTRRFAASMLVYLSILVLFAYIPLCIAKYLEIGAGWPFTLGDSDAAFIGNSAGNCVDPSLSTVRSSGSTVNAEMVLDRNLSEGITETILSSPSRFRLRFSYIAPQLHLPLELTVIHLGFLTILESKKSMIGHLLFAWLVFMCKCLGLSRFMLPHVKKTKDTRITISRYSASLIYAASAVAARQRLRLRRRRPAPASTLRNVLAEGRLLGAMFKEEEGGEVVGPVLRRPPPRWDARSNANHNRWAWRDEQPCDIEKMIAKRSVPKWWLPRLLILLASSWLVIAGFVLAIFSLPLGTGRALFLILQVPSKFYHDPIVFLVGALSLWLVILFLSLLQHRGPLISKLLKTIDKKTAVEVLSLLMRFNATALFFGFLIGFAPLYQLTDVSDVLSLSFFVSSYVRGLLLMALWTGFLFSGYAEKLFRAYLMEDADFGVTRHVEESSTQTGKGSVSHSDNDTADGRNAGRPDQADPLVPVHGPIHAATQDPVGLMLKWLIVLRETAAQPLLSIDRYHAFWQREHLRLRVISDLFVNLVFFEALNIFYTFAIVAKISFGVSALYGSTYLVITAVQRGAWASYLYSATKILRVVCRNLYRRFCASVKDEHYLIGRRLLNAKNL